MSYEQHLYFELLPSVWAPQMIVFNRCSYRIFSKRTTHFLFWSKQDKLKIIIFQKISEPGTEAELRHLAASDVTTAPVSNGWTTTTVGECQTFPNFCGDKEKLQAVAQPGRVAFSVSFFSHLQMWSLWWIPDMIYRGGPPGEAAGAPPTRPRLWGLSRAAGRCPPGPLTSNYK